MNVYYAKRQTESVVTYKRVTINVINDGLGFEYWFTVHGRKIQGLGFETHDAAVADARRAVDELHIH